MRLMALVALTVPSLAAGLISCGGGASSAWSHELEAMQVLTAAKSGNIAALQLLAGNHIIVDVSRQSMTLDEFLADKKSSKPLDKIVAAMSFEPGLRLSPLGNGTVQKMWVYPGFALTSPTCWSDKETQSALDKSLFSTLELVQFEKQDAYRGFSVGFAEDGEWVFFLETRVSRTPPNAQVAEDLRCK